MAEKKLFQSQKIKMKYSERNKKIKHLIRTEYFNGRGENFPITEN